MRHLRSRQGGQTLLEVFLASILVAVIIFAVVGLYPGCMASITRAHQVMDGSNVAQQELETLRDGPFPASFPWVLPALSPVGLDGPNGVSYLPAYTPGSVSGYGGSNSLAEVTVEVTWNATNNANYTYVLFNATNPP